MLVRSNLHTRLLPDIVEQRALSYGETGRKWLAGLDQLVADLEAEWGITAGETLTGGSHAFVCNAADKDGREYILKVDLPEADGNEAFRNSMLCMQWADGHGYAKILKLDLDRCAGLMEKLGTPLQKLGHTVEEEIRIICGCLNDAWTIPAENAPLPRGSESLSWFRNYITDTYEQQGKPCSRGVIDLALRYLDERERDADPAAFVLIHGDAHNGNILLDPEDPTRFKMVDPDGAVYEKGFDLGVVMREWPDEYDEEPLKRGLARCELLHTLTGATKREIWCWGYIQHVSTGLVLLQIGRKEEGLRLLRTAEAWMAGEPFC